MYSTDNGPENDTWPDGANTPFRSQKDTNWEGGWRVPCLMRWPGKIKPGTVLNGIASHIDMFPTLLAMAGNPNVAQQLLEGATVGNKKFNVHLDGFNLIPYLTGEAKESPRNELIYFSDDGDVMAVRVGDYKFVLAEQRATQMDVWAEPLVKLRVPRIFNLRRDPFERADVNSNTYWDWMVNHVPQTYLMQEVVANQIANFVKFPPRQKPAAFNLDAVMAQAAAAGQVHAGGTAHAAGTGNGKAKSNGQANGKPNAPANAKANAPATAKPNAPTNAKANGSGKTTGNLKPKPSAPGRSSTKSRAPR
jgi:arylsulfatase